MYVYIHIWTRTAHMRAFLSTRTNTYLHTHIYTHKLKHSYTHTHVRGYITFFQCQFDTLIESRVFNWKLIVGILWFFWFFCCYETRKSILHLPPWDRSKAQRNPCFSRHFFPPPIKKLAKHLYHTTGCGTNTFPQGKTWFLDWHPTHQPTPQTCVCVLLCFIKPILGNRYVRSRGFIVSEPRETHPRSEIADVPTLPCPPLDNLGCPDPHPSP